MAYNAKRTAKMQSLSLAVLSEIVKAKTLRSAAAAHEIRRRQSKD